MTIRHLAHIGIAILATLGNHTLPTPFRPDRAGLRLQPGLGLQQPGHEVIRMTAKGFGERGTR